jgi:MIP family channel proteins
MSHLGREDGKVGLLGIALAHGFVLMGAATALGSISGAHFNPAVTLAAWFREQIDSGLLAGYVMSQTEGALVASFFLAGLFPDEIALAALGTPMLAPKISMMKGLTIEALITFVLVSVILFSTRPENPNKQSAGIPIGATLAALILFAGPLTGAGANPVRFLGPALVSAQLTQSLVYLVGPLVGGGAAALVFGLFQNVIEGAPQRSRQRGEEPVDDDFESDGVDADDPSIEPEPARGRVSSPRALIRRARELFHSGEGERAAATLLPLLSRIDEIGQDIADSARTLLIVIEEEHGRLALLDSYRERLYRTPAF